MKGEERARLRAEPSLIPNNCCYGKLLHRTRRKLIMMVMTTVMVRMMRVSMKMMVGEKFDEEDRCR